MPAVARDPSGTFVLVLCGQPEQKYASRCWDPGSMRVKPAEGLDSPRKPTADFGNCASPNTFAMRAAITLAMAAGVSSPLGDRRMPPCGTCTHSPVSSYLPTTRGREAG